MRGVRYKTFFNKILHKMDSSGRATIFSSIPEIVQYFNLRIEKLINDSGDSFDCNILSNDEKSILMLSRLTSKIASKNKNNKAESSLTNHSCKNSTHPNSNKENIISSNDEVYNKLSSFVNKKRKENQKLKNATQAQIQQLYNSQNSISSAPASSSEEASTSETASTMQQKAKNLLERSTQAEADIKSLEIENSSLKQQLNIIQNNHQKGSDGLNNNFSNSFYANNLDKTADISTSIRDQQAKINRMHESIKNLQKENQLLEMKIESYDKRINSMQISTKSHSKKTRVTLAERALMKASVKQNNGNSLDNSKFRRNNRHLNFANKRFINNGINNLPTPRKHRLNKSNTDDNFDNYNDDKYTLNDNDTLTNDFNDSESKYVIYEEEDENEDQYNICQKEEEENENTTYKNEFPEIEEEDKNEIKTETSQDINNNNNDPQDNKSESNNDNNDQTDDKKEPTELKEEENTQNELNNNNTDQSDDKNGFNSYSKDAGNNMSSYEASNEAGSHEGHKHRKKRRKKRRRKARHFHSGANEGDKQEDKANEQQHTQVSSTADNETEARLDDDHYGFNDAAATNAERDLHVGGDSVLPFAGSVRVVDDDPVADDFTGDANDEPSCASEWPRFAAEHRTEEATAEEDSDPLAKFHIFNPSDFSTAESHADDQPTTTATVTTTCDDESGCQRQPVRASSNAGSRQPAKQQRRVSFVYRKPRANPRFVEAAARASKADTAEKPPNLSQTYSGESVAAPTQTTQEAAMEVVDMIQQFYAMLHGGFDNEQGDHKDEDSQNEQDRK